MNELVSIIIPCYKQAQYLPFALDSVLGQTYTHWECIVVSDGSPDETVSVAMSYREKDKRIQVVDLKQNLGLAQARNKGILLSRGNYILPLDADDYLAFDFLKASLQPFAANPKLKVVYTDATYFDAINETVHRPDFSIDLLSRENIFQPCALYKKADFEKTAGYRKALYGYEDWDFWIQLIDHNDEVFHVKRPLFYYRVKNESMLVALQGNPPLEREVRARIYAGNRKKLQKWHPALAYNFEKRQLPGDWWFKIKYRLQNLLSFA